jgi:hypothetical protein
MRAAKREFARQRSHVPGKSRFLRFSAGAKWREFTSISARSGAVSAGLPREAIGGSIYQSAASGRNQREVKHCS